LKKGLKAEPANLAYFQVYLRLNYIFFLLVLMPKGQYIGQKLIKLVKISKAATTKSTMANTPIIT